MIEKLLENWLTNTNERGYMTPYCQLLISKGYKLLYVSPHGMLEEGKDIIALNPKGKPETFQLKNGDITLGQWRTMQGEINELVTIPIQHPSVSEKAKFKSWLVTNGEVRDPVRTQIGTLNRNNWGQTKNKKLEYQDKGYLLADFLKYYMKFFPSEPKDFKFFLDLHLTNGREMFPKEKFTTFIEQHLQIHETTISPTKAASLIASSVIITSYILNSWVLAKNYVAQIEAWTCLIAAIFALVTKQKIAGKYYLPSLDILQNAITECFENLLNEVKSRKHLIEGDWRTDTVVYRARTTIILGYLCAYALFSRLKNSPLSTEKEQEILTICEKYQNYIKFPGEAYSPLLICYFWFHEIHGKGDAQMELIYRMLTGLSDPKLYPQVYGWPNPYYSYEESLRLFEGLLFKEHVDSFIGKSYTLRSLVEILARRNYRKILEENWRKITHTQLAVFIPDPIWETFLWKSENGTHQTRFPNQTQKWKDLIDEAFSNSFITIPGLLKSFPSLLLLFIIVYPHRLTSENVRFLDLLLLKSLIKKTTKATK